MRSLLALLAIFALAVIDVPAMAGGALLREFGTADVGLAGAGRGARAQDSSTTFFNPAGMSLLEHSELLGSFQASMGDIEFDLSSSSNTGGDGGQAGGFIPAIGGFGAYRLGEDWALGLGLAAYFAGAVEYDGDWAGRYYSQRAELTTVAIAPVASYQLNDWFSIGAGPLFLVGVLEQRVAVNNPAPTVGDGQMKLDSSDWGFGGQVGVMFEPRPSTRIGIKYNSKVTMRFEDALDFRRLGPALDALLGGASADVELTIPQFVDVSFFHQITEALAILATVSWEDHSAFGETGIALRNFNSSDVTADRNFKDTGGVAVGFQYDVAEDWRLSLGVGYDSSPVSKKDRTPDLPLDRQIRFGTGAEWSWRKNSTVGLAYEYLDLGDAPISLNGGPAQGSLSGRYEDNAIHFVAVNLIWRFGVD
jgi:long-chain fatty acid transport protein